MRQFNWMSLLLLSVEYVQFGWRLLWWMRSWRMRLLIVFIHKRSAKLSSFFVHYLSTLSVQNLHSSKIEIKSEKKELFVFVYLIYLNLLYHKFERKKNSSY